MCKYIIYIHVNYIHFVDQLFIDLIGFSADFFILKKRGESSLTEQWNLINILIYINICIRHFHVDNLWFSKSNTIKYFHMHLKPFLLSILTLCSFFSLVFLSMIFVFKVAYSPDGPGVRFIILSYIIYMYLYSYYLYS